MNILNEEQNEYEEENERIKVYLKVKPSLATDKIFYNISRDRKILSLLDNITLDDPKKSKKVELNKIFTHKDENSYIYEEIMRNCVVNSLGGENFTFISYGDSNSEKHNLIIGTSDCYENINNRGLLPRLLESYINKIDSNEILSDTISLNISYMLINNNNLIDLSQFMGRENKTLEKITKDELIKKYSKEIKIDDKNTNYLKSIKKTPIDKANDSLFFLLQIINLFYKFEATGNHFLTWSYFIIIIYVTDNDGKSISTLTFIIMPGNEILLHRFPKTKTYLGTERRDSISISLKSNAFECLYTSEDILEHLDTKQLMENTKENKDEKNTDKDKKNNTIKNKKKEIKSKLFHIIGNLAFDTNQKTIQYNRKYIIIGSIFGNSGLITNIKDTLYFLFQCQKFSHQKIANKSLKNEVDYTFFTERIKAKNEQIYDLESKFKTQETKINELNNLMDSKEHNLIALQNNYKYQLELLKEELGFKGDIDNLLKNNKKSKEYEFALKIRNTTDNNRLKNIKIEELKEQIEQINMDIKQLKNLLDMKENDVTMMKIIRAIREANINKKKEKDIRNRMGEEIENLVKKNKILKNKILIFKNEINLKKNLLKNLPDIFSNNINIKNNMNNFEIKMNDVKNDYASKLLGENNIELKNVENIEKNEKEIIINKYKDIKKQNQNEIINIKNKMDTMTPNFIIEKNKYLDELVFLYKSIINIIKLYKKSFSTNCSIFMNKDRFDKLLRKEEKYINPNTFPLLYEELGKIGYGHFQISNKKAKLKPKIIKSKYYKNIIVEDENNNKLEEQNDIGKKTIGVTNYNKKNERIEKIIEKMKNMGKKDEDPENPQLINEIIDNKTKIFQTIVKKTHLQFLTMTQEELQAYAKNFLEKMEKIENLINYYIGDINNTRKFDPVQEKIVEIKYKLKIINNKIKEISYKYQNNNIVFENGDKVIQRLKNENYLLRKQIYEYDKKNIFSTLSPSSHYSKFKTRNLSKKDIKSNLNNFNNHNYYNTILTTATSNGMSGQYNIPTTSRVFMEQNYNSSIRDKMTIDVNVLHRHLSYKKNIFEKRPISSINKLNPYYTVSENL